jgi:hypothetical protein
MADIGFSWVEWPYARIRRELETEGGVVTRFVFQLEYDCEATTDGLLPHDWRTVARFDHDLDGPHNVNEEGLHVDVYRDGEVVMKSYDFPPVPLRKAPRFCERYLQENADFLIDRFERWHDIGDTWE